MTDGFENSTKKVSILNGSHHKLQKNNDMFKRLLIISVMVGTIAISSLFVLPRIDGLPILSRIIVNVSDKAGHQLAGVSVQGFMETVQLGKGATGLKGVFNATTDPGGQAVITDTSRVVKISADWVNYQGAAAKFFSPRVLLFLTYTNVTTGGLYYEQDSVPLITIDFLNHISATVNHSMDLSHPIAHLKLPITNTLPQAIQTNASPMTPNTDLGAASIPIIGPLFAWLGNTLSWLVSPTPPSLPTPPAPGFDQAWVLNYTDGPDPSACCTNIPVAWGQVSGGAYGSISVSLSAAHSDDLNTGYASGTGYQMSSPTYKSGSAISSFQNQAAFTDTVYLNMCGGSGCTPSPSTGEIWIQGQMEGDEYWLWGDPCACGGGYIGANLYQIGIVNVPVSNNVILGGGDNNLPSYASQTAFGQDFYQAAVQGSACSGNGGTPTCQITSYGVTAQFLGNQIAFYANLAMSGIGLVFGDYPTIAAASGLGGIVGNLVGPIGSQDVADAASWIQYNAPADQEIYATSYVSNLQWQVSSSTGNVPITGYNAIAGPVLTCSADGSPTNGVRTVTTYFTSSCTGGIGSYSYNWYFPDCNTHAGSSTAQNPSWTFYWCNPNPPNSSVWQPTLTVTDSAGGTASPRPPAVIVTCGTSCPSGPT